MPVYFPPLSSVPDNYDHIWQYLFIKPLKKAGKRNQQKKVKNYVFMIALD